MTTWRILFPGLWIFVKLLPSLRGWGTAMTVGFLASWWHGLLAPPLGGVRPLGAADGWWPPVAFRGFSSGARVVRGRSWLFLRSLASPLFWQRWLSVWFLLLWGPLHGDGAVFPVLFPRWERSFLTLGSLQRRGPRPGRSGIQSASRPPLGLSWSILGGFGFAQLWFGWLPFLDGSLLLFRFLGSPLGGFHFSFTLTATAALWWRGSADRCRKRQKITECKMWSVLHFKGFSHI